MVKVTVLYGAPTDPDAFEDYYAGTHLPLAARMPNVERFEASKALDGPDGGDPPYYRIAELWFADAGAMQEAMGSDEGVATVADLGNFATGGVTVVASEII
jgi:uncharacterized protein (TIGR02118 family)